MPHVLAATHVTFGYRLLCGPSIMRLRLRHTFSFSSPPKSTNRVSPSASPSDSDLRSPFVGLYPGFAFRSEHSLALRTGLCMPIVSLWVRNCAPLRRGPKVLSPIGSLDYGWLAVAAARWSQLPILATVGHLLDACEAAAPQWPTAAVHRRRHADGRIATDIGS